MNKTVDTLGLLDEHGRLIKNVDVEKCTQLVREEIAKAATPTSMAFRELQRRHRQELEEFNYQHECELQAFIHKHLMVNGQIAPAAS